jgi:hypothetical protein
MSELTYAAIELEKLRWLSRRRVNELCKELGVITKGNSYMATEEDYWQMKNREDAIKGRASDYENRK